MKNQWFRAFQSVMELTPPLHVEVTWLSLVGTLMLLKLILVKVVLFTFLRLRKRRLRGIPILKTGRLILNRNRRVITVFLTTHKSFIIKGHHLVTRRTLLLVTVRILI